MQVYRHIPQRAGTLTIAPMPMAVPAEPGTA